MKKKLMLVILLFLLLLVISFANAEYWACFNYGEKIDFCNPKTPDRTCKQVSVPCQYCVNDYNESRGCYNQGNYRTCIYGIPPGCSSWGNGSDIDIEPPELTVNSPLPEGVYNSRTLLVNVSVDEKSDIYFIDNIYGRGRWTRIGDDCYGYSGKRSFKEGLNNLTFKASDVVGNTAYLNRTFFIDSKRPTISKTLPRKGFADGNFEVQFSELNPKSLILYYGNSLIGYTSQEVNIGVEVGILESLESGSSCRQEKGKYYCNVYADLKDYNPHQIEYWFNLTDIAGNFQLSKHVLLDVDTTSPIINNPSSMYRIEGNKVYFTIDITEENFDGAEYYDHNESRPRWKTLCSRLKNGICEAKKSFRDGSHTVDIQVTDKAGNSIAQAIEFFIGAV